MCCSNPYGLSFAGCATPVTPSIPSKERRLPAESVPAPHVRMSAPATVIRLQTNVPDCRERINTTPQPCTPGAETRRLVNGISLISAIHPLAAHPRVRSSYHLVRTSSPRHLPSPSTPACCLDPHRVQVGQRPVMDPSLATRSWWTCPAYPHDCRQRQDVLIAVPCAAAAPPAMSSRSWQTNGPHGSRPPRMSNPRTFAVGLGSLARRWMATAAQSRETMRQLRAGHWRLTAESIPACKADQPASTMALYRSQGAGTRMSAWSSLPPLTTNARYRSTVAEFDLAQDCRTRTKCRVEAGKRASHAQIPNVRGKVP